MERAGGCQLLCERRAELAGDAANYYAEADEHSGAHPVTAEAERRVRGGARAARASAGLLALSEHLAGSGCCPTAARRRMARPGGAAARALARGRGRALQPGRRGRPAARRRRRRRPARAAGAGARPRARRRAARSARRALKPLFTRRQPAGAERRAQARYTPRSSSETSVPKASATRCSVLRRASSAPRSIFW